MAQKSPPLPSFAELDILKTLWRLGPSTVREVRDALGKNNTYTTTLKQMQLMLEKGLLRRTERYRTHVYEPETPKQQLQQRIAGDVLQRAFEGSAKDLVLGALAAQPATDAELIEIRGLLNRLRKERRTR